MIDERDCELYIRSDFRWYRICYVDIMYVEALSDYIIVRTTDKQYIVHSTMKGIENKLPDDTFVRVHRSFIVNLDHIEYLEDTTLIIKDKTIPVGASFKESFMSRLNFL